MKALIPMKTGGSGPLIPVSVPRSVRRGDPAGFALIATISLLVLLAMVAVGLLSLSTVTLRESSATRARAEARANARLALHLALGELQLAAGDDRRITASASFLSSGAPEHAVGVWQSWSPGYATDDKARRPRYEEEKKDRFSRWLVSGTRAEQTDPEWTGAGISSGEGVELFSEAADGFSLSGSLVRLDQDRRDGALAWAVSQEATKAKLAVAGPEEGRRVLNDDLQAQPRPSLELADFFGAPEKEWDQRAARVLNFNQVALDTDIWTGPGAVEGGAHFTAVGAGLITDVVKGGFKTDLNLGFEMAESQFKKKSWSGEGYDFANPFHSGNESNFRVPRDYDVQRPLYPPPSKTGTFSKPVEFYPANVQYFFPVTAAPTFHSLRSFYRMPYHLYRADGDYTVFERPHYHVAAVDGKGARKFYPPPATGFAPPRRASEDEQTQLGIRPVMDRIMFLVSAGMSSTDELRLVITPVVVLWNPYNVALEIEGAVAYVWIDIPYDFTFRTYNSAGRLIGSDYMYVSGLMGEQFRAEEHGRSVNPYFYAAITQTGDPLTGGSTAPIHFEPGEVRVFAPAERTLTDFDVVGSVRDRTVFLRPVDSLDQFSTKGGLSVPTTNRVRSIGFTRVLEKEQSAQLTFSAIPAEDYPFYITLEDATRAKGNNPDEEKDRGQAIADILANSFSRTGETVTFSSKRIPYAELKEEPVPIGVLESYHRVAQGSDSLEPADLVYTGNPRQPWMNPFVSNTTFQTGPQYQIRMREVSTFNGVLQAADGGRSAYYGATQTPVGGRTHLSFFEIPRSPMLSLAGFQHADLSSTPFAPANQVGNSWASAYVSRADATEIPRGRDTGPPMVDHCYMLNEALWDSFFFSGAAPTLSHSSQSGSPGVWDEEVASVTRDLRSVLEGFARDPAISPLRNPRMKPVRTPADPEEWAEKMLRPEACRTIASELFIDGAFNVNSTSVEAWKAVLSGLRGASFEVRGRETTAGSGTPFPRFRDPVGEESDDWHGYRVLGDSEIAALAEELVLEIRERGPFLSLAEFINRRIEGSELGLSGALQTAIDRAELNKGALQESFSTKNYDRSGRNNISPNDTGVGIPGYLTQADVLQSLAPVITVRSDTFTIRTYGDSRDASGKVVARAHLEAIVQRYPEFIDPTDPAYTDVADLNAINQTFGRKFKVISYRFVPDRELAG